MPIILSCTDGSVYSPSVYDHTAWAAGRLGARVHVLHMLEPAKNLAPADVSGAIGVDAQRELMEEIVALEETRGKLAQARARMILQQAGEHFSRLGVRDVVLDQRHGSLVDSIESFEAGADLVVVGKRGEQADFAKLHLGSNLERVIRSCHHPVLVASRAFRPIQRFLIAYDGGPSVEKAVEYVRTNPLLQGLQCHLLRAGRIDDKAEWYLNEAAEKLRTAGYDVTARAISGEPEKVIAEAVAEHQIDLLVMGAYGHSRIRQFIVGSTTTTMVRTIHIPVLMFR